ALVTADLIGYSANLVAAIRENVSEKCGLKTESIMLSVTHTHSGPNTIARVEKDIEEIDQIYRETFVSKVSEMIIAAYNNAQESSLHFTQFDCSDLAHNRRIQQEDKTWTNEWTDIEGKHPGYVDNHLTLLAVHDAEGSLRALLINYACHPVTLGPGSLAISPDYVGYLKKELSEFYGIDQIHFCLAGCGNLNPRDCINQETGETQRMGKDIAQKICQHLDQMTAMNSAPAISKQSVWEFERTRERSKEKQMKDESNMINTEFQMLACDDLAIISLPGELFCEFNDRLRAASPWACTFVASITNDYIGYLPTDKAMAEGAYEVNMAPADNLESAIMEHCSSLLSEAVPT
ncbi:MAG: neutral/alkaline non-lysosomal ceramidase N-terminal domain-containing protein, partial [Planctomycetes bacterium]|nr:neutral/alkaline non-lysosomal ceramidase N-terminal domain-containing protein [Planctomycetota bacterium]